MRLGSERRRALGRLRGCAARRMMARSSDGASGGDALLSHGRCALWFDSAPQKGGSALNVGVRWGGCAAARLFSVERVRGILRRKKTAYGLRYTVDRPVRLQNGAGRVFLRAAVNI